MGHITRPAEREQSQAIKNRSKKVTFALVRPKMTLGQEKLFLMIWQGEQKNRNFSIKNVFWS